MTLREQLLALREQGYCKFTSTLMPGVNNVLGIRIPILRGIAREIARGDWRTYLEQAEEFYFEERMLQGLVIGYAKCTPEERLGHIARFVPKIDNWAVCDSHCMRRIPVPERDPMWAFIQPYFASEAAYDVRFAVVTALSNYIDEHHIDALFAHFDRIRHEGYYVRMAVAWAVSVCYVKFPERTDAWLRECALSDWTYNKARQKIVESRRVDADAKTTIRAMKRQQKSGEEAQTKQ